MYITSRVSDLLWVCIVSVGVVVMNNDRLPACKLSKWLMQNNIKPSLPSLMILLWFYSVIIFGHLFLPLQYHLPSPSLLGGSGLVELVFNNRNNEHMWLPKSTWSRLSTFTVGLRSPFIICAFPVQAADCIGSCSIDITTQNYVLTVWLLTTLECKSFPKDAGISLN